MAKLRLIDANALKVRMFRSKEFNRDTGSFDLPVVPWHDIEDADTIDAVEVVRCRECKDYEVDCGYCDYWEVGRNFDDYCSRGKKRDGGAEG